MERKPHRHWNDINNVLIVSKNYKTRNEFRVGEKQAYSAASKHGWLDIVCSHMVKPPSYNKGLSKEECQKIVDTCESREELMKKSAEAYRKALRYDLLVDAFGEYKRPMYWTKEKCHEAALKCETKFEFYTEYNTAYQTATHHGWLTDIGSHLKVSTSVKFPSKYWTKAKCRKEALKYDTKFDFQSFSRKAYVAALRKGWLDDITSHMQEIRKPNGYWTKEKCHQEALRFNHKTDFATYSGGALKYAQKQGWVTDICSHMTRKRHIQWTKEECHRLALTCKTKKDFYTNHKLAYQAAHKYGWLKDICSHITNKTHKNK